MNEKIFVALLESADLEVLRYIVYHDQSIVIYGLNKIPPWTIKLYLRMSGGVESFRKLSANDVRRFLGGSRPDILEIVDSKSGWLERELERAAYYLERFK